MKKIIADSMWYNSGECVILSISKKGHSARFCAARNQMQGPSC